MDEGFVCECGNDQFWFFWNYVRCPKCANEYKKEYDLSNHIAIKEPEPEYWVRRWNKKEMKFSNWEHISFK